MTDRRRRERPTVDLDDAYGVAEEGPTAHDRAVRGEQVDALRGAVKHLTTEQQEAAGILSAEVRARLAQSYAEGQPSAAEAPAEAATPGQTALFNNWEDAVECAKCGGRMVRTGSCYTCRDCGTNTGCS